MFQNSVNSEETVKAYTWYIDKFLDYCKIKDYDSLIAVEASRLQIMLEDYVMNRKKIVNPNSVPSFFYPVKTFFEANDIELKWRKIKRLFPAKVKKSGSEAYTDSDIQKMLSCTTSIKNKALIHFLASTACRIGSIPDIKLKHLSIMPNECKSVLIYEESTSEHFVFLTPEASKILDDYFEIRKGDGEFLNEESPLFRVRYGIGIQKSRPMKKRALEAVIRNVATRAGLRDVRMKKGNRFPKQLDHAFRKRFTTILKLNEKIPVAITERLLNHKTYNDEYGNKIQLDESYMRATQKQLFEKFSLAIPDLVISQEEKQKTIIENQREKIDKLEAKDREIEELKARFDIVESHLRNAKND